MLSLISNLFQQLFVNVNSYVLAVLGYVLGCKDMMHWSV